MRTKTTLVLFAALGLFLGCESTPEKKPATPAQENQPQFETGRFALQKMLVPSHLWAGDAQPINLRSNADTNNLGHDGKSGFWQATFASPSRQKVEPFSWSGLTGPDAPPKGINHGVEDSFNPGNRSTQPFDLAFLKVDSDKAFEVAQQHGGKQLLTKDPKQPVFYILDWDPRTSELRWHVIYGSSANNAQLTVIVNASTGDFMHKE
jgi:hypothetical protein